jgi:hypothetical protein
LRSLIEKVIVRLDAPGVASVRLVWRGGRVDQEEVSLKVGRLTQLPECNELEQRIANMAAEGLPDEWIAYRLSKEGFRQSHLPYVSIGLVSRVRCKKRLFRKTARPAVSTGCLTLSQAQYRTGITIPTLFDLTGQRQFVAWIRRNYCDGNGYLILVCRQERHMIESGAHRFPWRSIA